MPETNSEVKASDKDVQKEKKEAMAKKRVEGLKRFFVETKAEFKKIVWPTPKQVFNNTLVVLVTILVAGVFIWCLDLLMSLGLNAILKH